MRRFRKDGNIFVLTIVTFLFIALIASLFIALTMMGETHQRVETATETAAKTRALAVNIPLKEELGIIETYRPAVPYYEPNYTEPSYSSTPTYGYDRSLLNPASETYKQTMQDANKAAKLALISDIGDSLGKNEDGDNIIAIEEENICIQIKPLPNNDKKNRMDFECDVKNPKGDTVKVGAKNVDVYGVQHELNTSGGTNVYNVVFVGAVYEDAHFFYNVIQKVIHGDDTSAWSPKPIRAAWSIAYPQIDNCTSFEC